MIFTFFVPFAIVLVFFLKKNGRKLLYNECFWLLFFWTLILGVYIASGINWNGYGISAELVIFLLICLVLFYISRYIGLRSKVNLSERRLSHRRLVWFKVIGIAGCVLFVVDYVRLNSLAGSEKSGYQISFIGSVGILLVPILLVIGLYELKMALDNSKKNFLSCFVCLGMYSLPCLLNSGRESFLYVIIGALSIWAVSSDQKIQEKKNSKDIRKKVLFMAGIAILVLMIGGVSLGRFTNNEVNVYLYKHDVPEKIIEEANHLGGLKVLYYHVLSYFGHQIPFLDFMVKEYKGPYLLGMYELNIISRRLPPFLELDYNNVYIELNSLFVSTGMGNFSGSWQTVLGSFIIDFSLIGAPFIVAMIGLVMGKIRKAFYSTRSTAYAVFISLMCAFSFSTIQLGPFYNTLVYGAFIWWIIIFPKGEKKNEK